jgi:hypothetical protein
LWGAVFEVNKIYFDMFANFPEELRAAFAFGCEMEYEWSDDRESCTIRTKYPVAIVRNRQGRIEMVVEQREG